MLSLASFFFLSSNKHKLGCPKAKETLVIFFVAQFRQSTHPVRLIGAEVSTLVELLQDSADALVGIWNDSVEREKY